MYIWYKLPFSCVLINGNMNLTNDWQGSEIQNRSLGLKVALSISNLETEGNQLVRDLCTTTCSTNLMLSSFC